MLETIRSVDRGDSRLSPAIARKVPTLFRRIASESTKTGRPDVQVATPAPRSAAREEGGEPRTVKEERVLDLIAQGLTNRQIAATVFLAEGTVKNFVSRIMDKLHAHSRTELAVRAVRRGGWIG